MFKFKNLKILLFLMLFSIAGQSAWADKGDTKYSYYVAYTKVQINKTGAGLVYAQGGTQKDYETNFNKRKAEIYRSPCKMNESASYCDEIQDKVSAKTDFYLRAVEKEGYKFVCWKNENDEIISTSNNCTVEVTTTNYCGEYTEAESKDTTIWNNPQENNPNYYDALYTAVFEPLVKDPLIKVSSNNTNLGMTTITHEDNSNAVENDIGDDIVLFAYTLNYDKKFIGWQKNGETEIISSVNPLHLHVSEENAGEYTAVFEDGYKFCRMKNFGAEHRYVTAINDEGSLSNLTAIKLENSFDNVIANAGSVIEIYTDTEYVPIPDGEGTKKVTYHDFIVQNSSGVDKGYYNFSSGAYLRMPHYTRFADEGTWAFSQADITYNEEGKKTGLRFRDNNGQASFASLANDLYSQWYIEPIDKNLETCENYFSLDPDPAKLVEVDGKYYTTLRTSWNILFNPEQMTPYIVKSVNETEGTFEMEPISGNIIPAGTPVIIETKSRDIEENRMVPTKRAEASGAVPSGNQLVSSTKYFPNQSVAVANNYKKLMVNANGQLAFGGEALGTVNGNEAYLNVANEVVHDVQPVLTETTLAILLQNGEIGPNYKITDLTCVYARGNVLYCKDDNKALNKSVKADDEIDYIKEKTTFQQKDWDQSNWIAVTLPSEPGNGLLDHRLTNVVGRLKSKVNPEFEASLMPIAGEENPYDENTYITCNFWGDGHQKGVNHGEDAKMFFVVPKPMEIANVEWAMWDEEIGMFVMPSAAAGTELKGAFLPNFSMLENTPELTSGSGYHFLALIKETEESSQGKVHVLADDNSNNWTVYPLEWSTQSVITAIDGVQSGKTITRVVYYNLMGVESDKPHPGINIVETRYSDGTRTTTKIIR